MSKNSALEAILKQYETNTTSYGGSNSSEKFDLKNYFTTHLTDKQKSAQKRIRILPVADSGTPFVEVWGHKIQVEGEWKTFTCLKHMSEKDCPFCEASDLLRSSGKEADKEIAKKYSARKMYVIKVIDRDNEDHGVKFWRFNHDYRKQGVYDKIMGVIMAVNQYIMDPKTGRDLVIFIARDQNNKPAIQTITHVDPSPISEDMELAKEWLSDTRTWQDVYSVKPYEYLEIIVKGGVPVWNKELGKYVDKTMTEDSEPKTEEVTLGTPNVKKNIQPAQKAAPAPVVEETDDEEDDMPF